VKKCSARLQRDGFLAGIDEIPVFIPLRGSFSKTQNAIFGMEDRLSPRGLETSHQFRQTNSQINIGTVFNILRGPPGDLSTGKFAIVCHG